MNDHLIPNNRRPVVIADDRIAAGARATPIRQDDPEALLRQYLRLIRRVRSQRHGRHIALRRADVEALADHLGWTADQVLARLADMIGASSRQRATMLAVLATGASLITIVAPSSPATADEVGDAMPIVVVHDDVPSSSPTTSPAARHAPIVAPSMPDSRRTALDASDGAPGLGGRPLDEAMTRASGDAGASEPAIDDDHNTVAVGQPPVPPPTGTDDHDNTVGVGQPPVPPAPPAP